MKTIEIPDKIWAEFINVLYSAVLHIDPKTANDNCMKHIQYIITKALQEESVLKVNGKIVNKDGYISKNSINT